MINHTVLWRLSAPVSFSLLLFCTSCLHAQDETSLQNIKFYPSSLNSEFSNATRVQLGRVNFPEHNSFMLNPAGVNLTNPDTRNFDDEGLIRYQKQINQIEDLQGMFAEALYQPLLSVARLYQQRDDHISALQTKINHMVDKLVIRFQLPCWDAQHSSKRRR